MVLKKFGNKNKNDNSSSYNYLLGRVVRKPTPVLYNMIWQLNGTESMELVVHQICQRYRTHPVDVNWITHYKSPLLRIGSYELQG